MSKSTMLRTRRKDANIKPNRRRLDRKSSRGMIYENEELRLRTININAEVEKGQSDIKKLRRENEQLRREIWCLRDEYDKLDKLLKNKQSGSEHSSSCSSEEESDARSSCSCQSCETEETSQNQENVEKISNRQNLHVEFDHLSIVSEEKSPEKSDKSEENYFFDESNTTAIPTTAQGFIFPTPVASEKKLLLPLRPDQSYPINYNLQCHDKFSNDGAIYKTQPENTNLHQNVNDVKPKHFFSPLPTRKLDNAVATPPEDIALNQFVCEKTGPDLYVDQMSVEQETVKRQTIDGPATKASSNSPAFQTGGNLEELLQDIELISNDILQLSTTRLAHDNVDVVAGGSNSKFASFQNQNDPNARALIVCSTPENVENCQKFVYIDSSITPDSSTFQDPRDEQYLGRGQKPYKSELNVVLMPNPMPLIGFEKYKITQQSNPEISCGIKLDESQTQILSVQNSTVNFNNPPASSTATKTNLNNDFSLSLNALNSTAYLTAMFEQSKIHCPKCYNPFSTPFDMDKTIPTQNLFCQNCVQCELSLLQNQTAAIQNEIHPPPNYENYPIEIKPNTLNKNILQPDNQVQSVNNFETNLSETQTPKTALKIATHGPFPLPGQQNVDFSNSTEINSPRIMKENFPSGQDSSSIRNIDDSNVDKLTTSSSDDRVLKKICDEIPKSPGKSRKMRKLSIHFNGNKSPVAEKYNRSLSLDCATEHKTNKNLLDFGPSPSASSTPVKEPQRILPKFELKNIPENQELDSNSNKDSVTTTTPTTPTTNFDRKMSKCASNSASEKKHVQHVKLDKAGNGNFVNGNERKHKHESSTKKRRKNSTVEKLGSIKNRFDQKSYSIDLGSRTGSRTFDRHDWPAKHYDSYNEFTTSLSERERTNSLTSESSRNTIKSRKLSGFTTFNSHGKVPWCGCWGNGCL